MLQFVAAMTSNVAFSLRAILGKLFMDNEKVRQLSKLDGPNTFATMQAGYVCLCVCIYMCVCGCVCVCVYNTFATMQAGATLFTIPAVIAMEGASALWYVD